MAYTSSTMYGSSYRSTCPSSYTSSPSNSFYHSSYSSTLPSVPFDITPTPFSSYSMDASCAFPCWPRRSSLSESETSLEERTATSYLSDEELFGDVFEDEAHSGAGSPIPGASPVLSPHHLHRGQYAGPGDMDQAPLAPVFTESEILARAQQQRDLVRFLLAEKERRRQEQRAKRYRRRAVAGPAPASTSSSSSKKSSRSKLSAMTPIAEAE